ncbi:MAG: DUF2306 domain-containing protein [Pseudomonadota bacterium]
MSSTLHSAGTHPTSAIESALTTILRFVFTAGCVFYAVLAFDYFLSFGTGREGLWLQLFALLVSSEHVLGSGSVHVDQAIAYRNGYDFLLMHTTMGAIAMAIGPFQFIRAVRRKYPHLHRSAGKIYLLGILLSMIGGLGYLAVTDLDAVFSGAPFAISLLGLDIAVLFTGFLAYKAIRERDIRRHQSWMAFNFGLLLATPVLRLLWIVFALVFPSLDQAAGNLAITTFLLPLCLTGMLLWVAVQNRGRKLPAI